MKVKVLGCSGAEFPGHNPPGFLLDDEILFDAGSLTNVLDKSAQAKIKDIFITHAHLDHIRGISFLADNIIVAKRRQRVNIISIPLVIKTIKKNLLNDSLWPDFTMIPDYENAVLKYREIKPSESIRINDYKITPYSVHHSVPAVGYLVEDSSKKRFFYTGDTGPTDSTWNAIGDKKIHCLIIEVSFPNKMRNMAILTGHLTPQLLKEELMKIKQMPDKIYITHPKPQHFNAIKRELERLKIENLRLLKDGDIIRI
ncbi:cAMP phosphodiesterase class-II:metallo-beta-lactamase superfamily protein [Dissulfurispira thermophila]|uniref:cAMP phosphodiesterase class-II:metallo-beta-lactamase superfamily protein n=2 Tax=root TaxID=1 RepID=A0A7G1GZ54_9BACT|nr:3',5'-cyclic-nucleotide phosphodiesterase [Dissulfurispira thermophila]BCB95141.1 cAMP phosphodiesterase class-II:metallo-beta-lactamase superfamily protein [Dissulfurispira thermophila]